jgi:hypothetical protein
MKMVFKTAERLALKGVADAEFRAGRIIRACSQEYRESE